jgi:hypothetical protein
LLESKFRNGSQKLVHLRTLRKHYRIHSSANNDGRPGTPDSAHFLASNNSGSASGFYQQRLRHSGGDQPSLLKAEDDARPVPDNVPQDYNDARQNLFSEKLTATIRVVMLWTHPIPYVIDSPVYFPRRVTTNHRNGSTQTFFD